jgi:hypothetical protein
MKPGICEKTGKARYSLPQDAAKTAKLLSQRHGTEITTYRCTFCGGHHLTGHTRNQRLILRQKRGEA